MLSTIVLGLAAFSTAVVAQANYAIPSVDAGQIETAIEQLIPTQVAQLIPHVRQHYLMVDGSLLLLNLNLGNPSHQRSCRLCNLVDGQTGVHLCCRCSRVGCPFLGVGRASISP